jgi:hypothetical protein
LLLSSAVLAAGSLAAQPACPDTPSAVEVGTELTCRCSAAQTELGAVWGTDRYTADSSLCRAAVHAGVIGAGGGTVTLQVRGGCSMFQSDLRRGISSGNWGAYDKTFSFDPDVACVGTAPAGLEECPPTTIGLRDQAPACGFRCHCSPAAMSGSVWGDGLYTADSTVCAAARHAGAVPSTGGEVAIFLGGRCESFQGRTRNGLQSADWGPYDRTIAFEYPLPRCADGSAPRG